MDGIWISVSHCPPEIMAFFPNVDSIALFHLLQQLIINSPATEIWRQLLSNGQKNWHCTPTSTSYCPSIILYVINNHYHNGRKTRHLKVQLLSGNRQSRKVWKLYGAWSKRFTFRKGSSLDWMFSTRGGPGTLSFSSSLHHDCASIASTRLPQWELYSHRRDGFVFDRCYKRSNRDKSLLGGEITWASQMYVKLLDREYNSDVIDLFINTWSTIKETFKCLFNIRAQLAIHCWLIDWGIVDWTWAGDLLRFKLIAC